MANRRKYKEITRIEMCDGQVTVVMTAVCPQCGVEKSRDKFININSARKKKPVGTCIECRTRNNERRHNNERRRNRLVESDDEEEDEEEGFIDDSVQYDNVVVGRGRYSDEIYTAPGWKIFEPSDERRSRQR